jgi:hypothetical protein
MWLRRFSSGLVFAAALAAQTGGLDSILNQFEAQGRPSPDQLQRNLAQISGGLRQGGWGVNPRLRDYLGSVQGVAGGNRGLGLSMSGIYRQLGGMESNPQMAWLNYRNAYLLLNQFPMDGQIRNEMQQIRRSVEVVETRMPELPRLDWSSLDAASQKEYDAVMERYISVSSTASSAEVTAETMRRSMAGQGLSVRPDIVSGLTRMKLKLEDAKRLIEQKNYATAKDRLASAEAEAQKILKSFGG